MAQSFSLKALLALVFAFFLQVTIAIPIADTSLSTSNATDIVDYDARDLFKRYVGTPRGKTGDGPDASDYPNDDDIRKAFTNTQGPYIFYSGIGSDTTKVYQFSQEIGGVILRNALPKKYLNQGSRSAGWLGDFWDRASGIYAEIAPGDVYFVSNWPDGTAESCSIWTRIEFPTLKANSNVQTVTLVNADNFNDKKQIYKRGSSKREAQAETLARREDACDGADLVNGPDA